MSHKNVPLGRREVLRLAAISIVSGLIAACQRAIAPGVGSNTPVPPPVPTSVPVARTPSLTAAPAHGPAVATATTQVPTPTETSVPITSNENFYRITEGPEPTAIPPNWKLAIAGLVDQTLTLGLEEIQAMPSVTEMRTLSCISNPVGGTLISNAIWKGVRLKDLLARARVQNRAHFLQLHAYDGYTTGIPLELALDEHALLVYEMNGVPLPLNHGAPLRCLWPGRYGMKQPKWLESITLVEKSFNGHWESQGWSNEAKVRPFSRMDSPGEFAVIQSPNFSLSGIAFTDESGLAQVEIGWDDADTWHAAELTRGPSPYTWTVWKWTGPALPPGQHVVLVRATDGRGQTQSRGRLSNYQGGTFPNGTDQMHGLVLEFKI